MFKTERRSSTNGSVVSVECSECCPDSPKPHLCATSILGNTIEQQHAGLVVQVVVSRSMVPEYNLSCLSSSTSCCWETELLHSVVCLWTASLLRILREHNPKPNSSNRRRACRVLQYVETKCRSSPKHAQCSEHSHTNASHFWLRT
jgi:hypothetical protein